MTPRIESRRHDICAIITLLSAVVHARFQDRHPLVVDHAFADGYYCYLEGLDRLRYPALANEFRSAMQQMQREQTRLKIRKTKPKDWEHLHAPRSGVIRPPILILGDYSTPSYEFTTLDLDDLPEYDLQPYADGLLLRIAPDTDISIPAFIDSPKLFETMAENEEWGRILRVETISDLNGQIINMGFKEMIWVAEALQDKKIAAIADQMAEHKRLKIIFIAGPSSSGKTTFTKKLSTHLLVNGIRSLVISMDDYFLDRHLLEPQADGTLDFESIDCLDLESIQKDLKHLIYGEPIQKREYDFKNGQQHILPETLSLAADQVLILEGIHGLNPIMGEGLPAESFFRIYISALTQLNIDNTHPVSTSDGRLIRRIVRDHNFRGYTADDTLTRWNSVRYGELRNIFPFQEQADAMFNSALVYELSILKRYAIPLLRQAAKNTVRNRLINLLSLFQSIPDRHVPGTSILREFIGKSYFSY